MLDLFGWDVGMSTVAAGILLVGALVIGGITQIVGETRRFHWLPVAAGAFLGGYLGSEAFGSLSTWGPAFEGLYIVPALIGAAVLGAIVDGLTRYAADETYTAEPRPV
jgi:uncharacterized membrane protein YeaQ/YmgE (transglycosylase-associated protein family)